MKVLIITYYWPPAGGSGVQRWLKFVKYLREFDVEPVVYTVQNPNYPIEDSSLIKEVPNDLVIIKQPIKEPNHWMSFLKKKHQKSAGFLKKKPSILEKIALFIRANYFIPDARKFWIKPSVNYLTNYLKDNPVDLIISSGPPHSLHIIAKQLKEKLGLKWIADFRDPWTDIDYFHQLPLTSRAKKKHYELEEDVVRKSDHVIVVGEHMRNNYLKHNDQITVITNGYDDQYDDQYEVQNIIRDDHFSMVHIGMLNADRNPTVFWKVLHQLINEDAEFVNKIRIKLIGKVADEVKISIKKYGLERQVQYIDYVSHQEALLLQRQAQVLLLIVNQVPSAKGIITGKIFEYLQAKRPILAIAPTDGDLADILAKTNGGKVIGFTDEKELKIEIERLFNIFQTGKLAVNSKNIEQYHRRALTQDLASLIKRMIT